jgi:hypothetical protein
MARPRQARREYVEGWPKVAEQRVQIETIGDTRPCRVESLTTVDRQDRARWRGFQ